LTPLPAAWTVEEMDACFIVKDPAGLSLAWRRAKAAKQWCFLRSATTLLGLDHPAAGPKADTHVFHG
jgi:hypothetical protein